MDPPRPVESEEGGAGMDPPARGGRGEEGAPPLALGGGGRRGRCRRPMEEAGGTREEGATVVVSSLVSWRSRVDVEREGSAAANDEIPSCGSGRERTAKKIEPVGDMLHGGTHGQFFRVCIRVLLERWFFYALQEVGLAAETAHFTCSHPQLAGNSLRHGTWLGVANLRSTVRRSSVRSISRPFVFFLF